MLFQKKKRKEKISECNFRHTNRKKIYIHKTVLIRPQIESFFHFRVPHFKKDLDKLEMIQRQVTMI